MKVKLDENLPEGLAARLVGSWERSFAVLSDHKLRVRRPPP